MPPESASDLVHNERVKLRATTLNNIGVAMIVTGAIVPTVSAGYGTTSIGGVYLFSFASLWLIFGVIGHMLARRNLGRLRP